MTENNRIVQYPADTAVLREGENCTDMYQIIRGHAEIYTGYQTKEEVLLGIIGPQACFGEFGLLLHKPAIYTVVAYSDLVLLRITEESMGNFIKDNQWKIMAIMRNMANTMLVMQQQISLLANEVEQDRKPDPITIHKARRSLRGYAIYNTPPFDPSDMESLFDSLS